jgi:hypothetical protein
VTGSWVRPFEFVLKDKPFKPFSRRLVVRFSRCESVLLRPRILSRPEGHEKFKERQWSHVGRKKPVVLMSGSAKQNPIHRFVSDSMTVTGEYVMRFKIAGTFVTFNPDHGALPLKMNQLAPQSVCLLEPILPTLIPFP